MAQFDESLLIKNPFTVSLKIQATKIIDGQKLTFKDGMYLPHTSLVDRGPSTKLFHNKDNFKAVLSLSECAKALYLFIAYSLDPGKDYISLDASIYLKKTGLKSKKTMVKAINELMRHCFIVETEFKDVFWINPGIFFCGSRLSKYSECVEVKGTWEN